MQQGYPTGGFHPNGAEAASHASAPLDFCLKAQRACCFRVGCEEALPPLAASGHWETAPAYWVQRVDSASEGFSVARKVYGDFFSRDAIICPQSPVNSPAIMPETISTGR